MQEEYCHATIVTPEGIFQDTSFCVVDGRFSRITPGGAQGVDLGGAYVLPGFIDSHIHGFNSFDFENPDCDFSAAAKIMQQNGVTSFLPTICPAPLQDDLVKTYATLDCPAIIGVHLEGPFINPERKGGFAQNQILPYHQETARKMISSFKGRVKLMTCAPEMVTLEQLHVLTKALGVRLCAGHTQADSKTALAAFNCGFSCITHFYNAMPDHHHRIPSIWDEAMLNDSVMCEVIADLHHVSQHSLAILIKCKGPQNVIAVTDSVCTHGEGVIVQDGLIYKGGVIHGSKSTMYDLFINLVRYLKVSLPEAVSMTSSNIARFLDLPLGNIKEGYHANFLLMDKHLRLKAVHTGTAPTQISSEMKFKYSDM